MTTNTNTIHKSHPKHPLQEVADDKRYKCDGCRMEGKGKRYRCEICDFDLHPNCMYPNKKVIIQGQECRFLDKPRPGVNCKHKKVDCANKFCRSCDACGKTIMGFVYHCFEKDWDFHPKCVKLEAEIPVEDVKFRLQKEGPSKCAWCKRKLLQGAEKKIPGWSYVSEDNDDYSFHVYCVMEMAMQSTSSNSNNASTSGNTSSLAVRGSQLPLKTKSKNASKSNKWLRILKIFIGTVFSILLGDPTTLLASTMAHFVVEGLFNPN